MTDLFSQFIKDASIHSPFYPEDDDYLVREEDNKKRIEEEQRKIEELQKTEQEKLQDIQETLEKETSQPDNLFSSFINDASQVTVNETLNDIPISRRVQFGGAQEPTIAGSLFRLGEAGIDSLFSSESFSEAAQRIEAERQKKIFEEFPEFYGRQEDLTVLSGRMGVAIADPVTFFIPWVKIAKAGRIATIAAGSSVAAGEALLREKALYGEVSPAIIAASAGLGGVSTGIGSLIANRLGGGKINQTVNTVDDTGNVVKTKVIDGSTPKTPALDNKTVDDLTIISREIYEENQPTIQSMTKNIESAGAAYQKIDLLKEETAKINNILSSHLFKMKRINKNHIVFDAKNKIVFKPSKLISATKGKQMFNQLQKNKEELKGLRGELNTINIVKQPEDTAILGVESLYKAYQKGLLEGKVGESLTRALVQEVTRPLFGATAGGLTGIYAPGFFFAEEDSNQGLYRGIAAGAFAGFFSKRLELSKYKILPTKIKTVANNEVEKVFKETAFSSMKRILSTSQAALLQSRNPILQKFGLDFLRNQGTTVQTGQVLQDSVEGLADISFDHFKRRLFEIIGLADDDTIEAAGRILQQRNMPSNARYSFLQKGDLKNTKAKTLADNLFKLNVSFKNYMKKAGVEFTEQDSYGLTQILDVNKLEELGFDRVVSILKDAFKLQSIKYKGKKVPGFSKVDSVGNLVPIKVLTDKQAEKFATAYVTSSDNLRRQLVLDADKLADNDVIKSLIKNNGNVVDKNGTIIQSARFFENERVLFDQEARALAKEVFIQDPIATNLSLFDNSIKVAEFSRRYGTKGQGIQDIKNQLINYYSKLDKNFKTKPNPSLLKLYKKDLQDISNTVNAYFRVLDADKVPQSEAVRTGVLLLQTLLATTKLTKVAIPSLGDTIQTIQNSGYKAAWNSGLRKLSGGKQFSKELALDVENQGKAWGNRRYNGALERELANFTLDANTNRQRQLVEFQRKFFETIQLGRVTRFAREYAYDAGAFKVFDLSKQAVRKTKLTDARVRELNFFGLDIDAAKYLGKFKNIDDAYEDRIGKVLIDRAGRRAADRDALIPQVGNRRLFAQSKNPVMKLAGSFLSWAQAKGTQTNSLIRRIEEGDGKLALMMLASLPLYAAVRDLYVAVNPNKDFRDNHGEFFTAIKEKDLEKLTEAMVDSAIFSGQLMPWYLDKIVNAKKFAGSDAIETIYPAAGLLNDFFRVFMQPNKGLRTRTVNFVEVTMPFGKDITRSEKLGEILTEDDITLKEVAQRKDKDIVPIPQYSTGGLVSGPKVSDTKEDPADRVDPFTGAPYSDQMTRLGFNKGAIVDIQMIGNKSVRTYEDGSTEEIEIPEEIINEVGLEMVSPIVNLLGGAGILKSGNVVKEVAGEVLQKARMPKEVIHGSRVKNLKEIKAANTMVSKPSEGLQSAIYTTKRGGASANYGFQGKQYPIDTSDISSIKNLISIGKNKVIDSRKPPKKFKVALDNAIKNTSSKKEINELIRFKNSLGKKTYISDVGPTVRKFLDNNNIKVVKTKYRLDDKPTYILIEDMVKVKGN